jgi:hypothetical protein
LEDVPESRNVPATTGRMRKKRQIWAYEPEEDEEAAAEPAPTSFTDYH